MRKTIFFLIFISVLTTSITNAESSRIKLYYTTFTCPDLTFTVSPAFNTVNFSNIRAFGVGEMLADVPMGMTLDQDSVMKAEFNWYYTTEITIKLNKQLWQYEISELAEIDFSFDDGDGIRLKGEQKKCSVERTFKEY